MRSEQKQKDEILEMCAKIASIIGVLIMALVFLFDNGILSSNLSENETGTVILNVEVAVPNNQSEQAPNQSNGDMRSGYESFVIYKGRYFSQGNKVYKYSGSYIAVSDDSNVTRPYYKYYYTVQD